MWPQVIDQIKNGDTKAISRSISLIENETDGFDGFLQSLPYVDTPIIGITGPPGAGKSTLTDALIGLMVEKNKKVAVLCVDPSSPFNLGALLGDRIRLNSWYNNANVFIRSLATRGSLGGLHPKIIEITDLLKVAGFDYIIVETVGVGQSEIEITGLADATIVVLVPESGDEIQSMKAGLMEIADIFVVNKCDRPDADIFVKNLRNMIEPVFTNRQSIEIIKTIATEKNGVERLFVAITDKLKEEHTRDKKQHLLAEKAYLLIQKNKMKGISKTDIYDEIKRENIENLYKYVAGYTK